MGGVVCCAFDVQWGMPVAVVEEELGVRPGSRQDRGGRPHPIIDRPGEASEIQKVNNKLKKNYLHSIRPADRMGWPPRPR